MILNYDFKNKFLIKIFDFATYFYMVILISLFKYLKWLHF